MSTSEGISVELLLKAKEKLEENDAKQVQHIELGRNKMLDSQLAKDLLREEKKARAINYSIVLENEDGEGK